MGKLSPEVKRDILEHCMNHVGSLFESGPAAKAYSNNEIDDNDVSEFLQEVLDSLFDKYKLWTKEETVNEPYLCGKYYNPDFGDNRMCTCGHDYYRHFDSYFPEDPAPGCKYCGCYEFQEIENESR